MIAQRMKNLRPYVPGEQPTDREYIKLNANENPFPPSPAVAEAVSEAVRCELWRLSRYTDPDATDLRRAIAGLLNSTGGVLCRAVEENGSVRPAEGDRIPFEVTADMIHVGNGSDEVLSHVFYAFFDGDRPLVVPEHSYSFYPVYAGFYGIPLRRVPLLPGWGMDIGAMTAAALGKDSATIFANPNAPTALAVSREEIRSWLRAAPAGRPFVVDEAYCDFGGESAIPLIAEFPNLVVVRTFSKSLCGAGQRLGFVVARPEMVAAVRTVKNSFNHFPVDFLASVAGKAACGDAAYYVRAAREICRVRDSFAGDLRKLGWLVTDSRTNFLFARKDGVDGRGAYGRIKECGILVRRFDTEGIEDFLRISVGTAEQMDALLKVMEGI